MDEFDRLAADTTSSATSLTGLVVQLLRDARRDGAAAVAGAARGVCAAQPSMGAFWNLAAAALHDEPRFEALAERARRSPAAAARIAGDLLRDHAQRIVTCSRSAMVEAAIRALRGAGISVRCAESRPGLEGRALAAALAADAIAVELVADAAIASDFRTGDVVIVGADAVAADWFLNKTGTGQLCAAALLAGVPAYVVAGREKFVGPSLAAALRLREDAAAAVWADPPVGVRVANPLFERVPLDRVAGVISDTGLLAGGMIAAACDAVVPDAAARVLLDLSKDW